MSVEVADDEVGQVDADTDFVAALTDREIAIANDEDPDAIETVGADAPADAETLDEPADDTVTDPVEPAEVEPAVEAPVSVHTEESVTKAKGLGLTDEDIEAFTTPASLRLHVSLLERLEKLASKPADETTDPASPKDGDKVTDDQPAGNDLPDVIDMNAYTAEDAGWDDPLALNVVRHVERVEKRYAELQQRFDRLDQAENQRTQMRMLESFHETVDGLGDESLFGVGKGSDGRAVNLSQAQLDNRTKLFQEADTIALALQTKAQRDGVAPPNLTWEEIVTRARAVAFADAPAAVKKAATEKSRADALRAQSGKRRPVSSSAGATGRLAHDDSPESIANSPEVVARWEQYQQANGG